MYLVACKWIANGEVGYKLATDYLESNDSTVDEIEYAISVLGLGPEIEKHSGILTYHWLENASTLDKISTRYYTDLESFNQWNTSQIHTEFLAKRAIFLTATGITLQVVQKDVVDESDSASYEVANALFE